MIPQLRQALRDIENRKGDFALFALVMRTDAPGRYDLVVSAPWLEAGKLKATSEFVELLSDSIGDRALSDFSRVSTLGTDHPLVRFLVDSFAPVVDNEVHARSTDLLEFQIDEVVILQAKKTGLTRQSPPNKALYPTAAGRLSGRG